jgi:hypothetical protein
MKMGKGGKPKKQMNMAMAKGRPVTSTDMGAKGMPVSVDGRTPPKDMPPGFLKARKSGKMGKMPGLKK